VLQKAVGLVLSGEKGSYRQAFSSVNGFFPAAEQRDESGERK
jgi:hypothetical protein